VYLWVLTTILIYHSAWNEKYILYGAFVNAAIVSYLFSFRESVQDYKIHMDMEIVKHNITYISITSNNITAPI